jgi:hypothetical protein
MLVSRTLAHRNLSIFCLKRFPYRVGWPTSCSISLPPSSLVLADLLSDAIDLFRFAISVLVGASPFVDRSL